MRGEIETGAPNLDELRGGLGCFRRLVRDLDEPAILRELAARFGYIGDSANRRIEIGRVLREVAPPIRGLLLADTAALAQAAATGRDIEKGNDAYWNSAALNDALTNIARVSEQDRTDFKQLVETEASKMQAGDGARLRRIVKDVANGLGRAGIEQGESLRASRNEVLDLVSDAGGERCGLAWLLLGWLSLWNSAHSADAMSHFSQGIVTVGEDRSYLAHLLLRFLGIALEAGGRHPEALESARSAMAIRPCANVALEASRYATQCGRAVEAKRYFELAVREEPMYLFVALADPDMAGLETVVVSEYATAGALVRQIALRALEDWQAMIARIQGAQRCLGEAIEIPSEFVDGLDEMRTLALKSGVLETIGVRSAIRRITAELYEFALRKFSGVVRQRDSDAAAAKGQVTEAIAKQESVSRNSDVQAEAIIVQAEADLRKLLDGGRTGGTLGNAIGGSFVLLVLYTAAAGLMGPRGIDTSFDSPFGMAGTCLIAAPVILGIGASAAGGVKRAALAAEIERRARYAREKARVTLVEVEKSCARSTEGSKAACAELETRARAATEALRLLKLAPQETTAMKDPRSVSKLAA